MGSLSPAASSTACAELSSRGWLHIESLGVDDEALDETMTLLDGLFDRFAALPAHLAHDLGGGSDRSVPVIPEILDTSRLEPRLRRTEVFAAAGRLARDLLGSGTYLAYDHAIYKPPGASAPTSWHQDSGYDEVLDHGLAIWIPFQDTDVIDGCTRYVSGSHRHGRLPHAMRTTPDGKIIRALTVDERTVTDVPCRRGGATVHDFHLVHGAGPNLGSDVRRAWVLDFSTASVGRRAGRAVKRVWKRA